MFESFPRHAFVRTIGAVYINVLGPCLGPEGPCASQDLKCRQAGHDVEESPPPQTALGDHGGRDEWTDGCTQSVEAVQEPQQLVRLCQGTNPGIPGRVEQAIAQACEYEDSNDGGVGRVRSNDGIADEFAGRCNDGNTAASNEHVQAVAAQGGYRIAGEGRKEDQGGDDVGQTIVLFDLECIE